MLLFSYLFPCCQAFYFLLITSAIELTSVYQYYFLSCCLFIRISSHFASYGVFYTQSQALSICRRKKIYSATWRDLPKTHKYYLPTRLLQNEFFFTSSPHVFECFIHSHTVLTEGSIFQLTSSLAIALAQKSNRVQPGHFHMRDGKQVRHKIIELHFSALPHYHSWLSEISYNNYASF